MGYMGFRQRWKVMNYIYLHYCNWVAFFVYFYFLKSFLKSVILLLLKYILFEVLYFATF